MEVRDSEGRKWEILPTDPAWVIASGLRRRGYDSIILPTETIRYGTAPTNETSTLTRLAETAYEAPTVKNALTPAFLAACTLYDCVKGAYEFRLIGEEE